MTEDEVRGLLRDLANKDKRDPRVDLFTTLLWMAVVYAWLNPEAYSSLIDYVKARWQAFRHRVSVWQARVAIESLPETDEPPIL